MFNDPRPTPASYYIKPAMVWQYMWRYFPFEKRQTVWKMYVKIVKMPVGFFQPVTDPAALELVSKLNHTNAMGGCLLIFESGFFKHRQPNEIIETK
jgi:hypothetical protein